MRANAFVLLVGVILLLGGAYAHLHTGDFSTDVVMGNDNKPVPILDSQRQNAWDRITGAVGVLGISLISISIFRLTDPSPTRP